MTKKSLPRSTRRILAAACLAALPGLAGAANHAGRPRGPTDPRSGTLPDPRPRPVDPKDARTVFAFPPVCAAFRAGIGKIFLPAAPEIKPVKAPAVSDRARTNRCRIALYSSENGGNSVTCNGFRSRCYKTVEGSTLTPGPMVELIATFLR